MESKVAGAIGAKFGPVAILFSNEKPADSKQFSEGKWGCVMFMLAAVTRGGTAVFDRKTFGCFGGGVGLGFGNQYENFPGGIECFKFFLSNGNDNWEQGRQTGAKIKQFMTPQTHHHFMHGERYFRDPEKVEKFIDSLPMTDIEQKYVIFKPLAEVAAGEKVEVVIFLGDLDQISALNVLVNFGRGHNENVIFPFAAGCQSICIYPLAEREKAEPRAVLGLSDISARIYLKRALKADVMSLSVPFNLYEEMENNLEESFLKSDSWSELQSLRKQ